MKNTKVKKIKEYIADHETVNDALTGIIIGGIVVSVLGIGYVLINKGYKLGQKHALEKIMNLTKESSENNKILGWRDIETGEELFYSFGKALSDNIFKAVEEEVKP